MRKSEVAESATAARRERRYRRERKRCSLAMRSGTLKAF